MSVVREKQSFRVAVVLFLLTLLSMFWVGSQWAGSTAHGLAALWQGYSFALPLMAILLSHELGHYIAARIHRVDTSPPYFLPMPYTLIGTFGAVIRMRGTIERRDALLDIGAAGPLCGFIVAVPVLVYGIATSPIEPLKSGVAYMVEGRSLFYLALLHWLKGPIPEGHDIMLSPTALAGWAGLLVTMMNLVPVGQLDGGHVAYALFGEKQNVYSRRVRRALFVFAIALSGASAWAARGADQDALINAASAGVHWLIWGVALTIMARVTGEAHPPTRPSTLSTGRRIVAWSCLALFMLLFMPTWLRFVE